MEFRKSVHPEKRPEKLDNQLQKIQSERDLFLFHTHLQLAEEDGTIQTLRQQMKEDEEIIRLRKTSGFLPKPKWPTVP